PWRCGPARSPADRCAGSPFPGRRGAPPADRCTASGPPSRSISCRPCRRSGSSAPAPRGAARGGLPAGSCALPCLLPGPQLDVAPLLFVELGVDGGHFLPLVREHALLHAELHVDVLGVPLRRGAALLERRD